MSIARLRTNNHVAGKRGISDNPAVSNFPEAAREKIGQLLQKPTSGKLITTEHRKVIAQICEEAREAGMPIERLVVILKNVLDQTPHSADSPNTRAEIRERLIAVCIEEYYRNQPPPKS